MRLTTLISVLSPFKRYFSPTPVRKCEIMFNTISFTNSISFSVRETLGRIHLNMEETLDRIQCFPSNTVTSRIDGELRIESSIGSGG